MKKQFEIYNGETKITYDESEANNHLIVEKIIDWCKRYNISSGESLMQKDDGLIYAPELVADIIDCILNFEADYGE